MGERSPMYQSTGGIPALWPHVSSVWSRQDTPGNSDLGYSHWGFGFVPISYILILYILILYI